MVACEATPECFVRSSRAGGAQQIEHPASTQSERSESSHPVTPTASAVTMSASWEMLLSQRRPWVPKGIQDRFMRKERDLLGIETMIEDPSIL